MREFRVPSYEAAWKVDVEDPDKQRLLAWDSLESGVGNALVRFAFAGTPAKNVWRDIIVNVSLMVQISIDPENGIQSYTRYWGSDLMVRRGDD